MIANEELLPAVDEYVRQANRRTCDEVVVEPFRAYLHRTLRGPWFSYATPFGAWNAAGDVDEPITKLRALFQSRGRRPRFEWTELRWPALAAQLEGAGLSLEARYALMLGTPAGFQSFQADGVEVRFIAEGDDLQAYQALKSFGFGGVARLATVEQVAALRDDLREGARYVLATLDGEAAGVGGYISAGQVCEIVSVATLPSLRRRGVATTITGALLADHWARGGTLAWLTAGNAQAEAVYRRLGLRTLGARLCYSE